MATRDPEKRSTFTFFENPPKRFLTPVLAALIATLVVVGLLLVHVWSRYRVLNLGYEVSGLTQEREDLLEANRRLRLEVRVLSRADRLEPMARRQLGLIVPRPEQILYKTQDALPLPNILTGESPLAALPDPLDADSSYARLPVNPEANAPALVNE